MSSVMNDHISSPIEEVEDHQHCTTCIKTYKCKHKRPSENKCPIVDCSQGCGFEFHRCKQTDHSLLCRNERIQCINHNFGCPIYLPRHELAKHISCCPASVLHCYVEWNRWPRNTRDRKLTQPAVSHTLSAQNLDVALALRDQRMLKELCNVARKTRVTLRNNFTQKYPAVPLKPYCGVHLDSTNELRSCGSMVQSLCSILTLRLNSDNSSDSSSSQAHCTPHGNQRIPCELSDDLLCESSNSDSSNSPFPPPIIESSSDKSSNSFELVEGEISHSFSPENSIPTPPLLPDCLSLSLDLNLNSFLKFHPKPKLMYTFICAQEFRRDEYGSHYKNFHGDIMDSLDGWMEHRCPLWQYGCNFVHRRVHPLPRQTRIIFNPIIESFGHLTHVESPSFLENNDFPLSNLPYEIILKILGYLDGFSLKNISLTCRKLRNISSLLLKDRGIVVLEWERSSSDAKNRWVVGNKRWAFTTNFTEVQGWYLDEKHDVLNHLSNCPYYEFIRPSEPFNYGFQSAGDIERVKQANISKHPP